MRNAEAGLGVEGEGLIKLLDDGAVRLNIFFEKVDGAGVVDGH